MATVTLDLWVLGASIVGALLLIVGAFLLGWGTRAGTGLFVLLRNIGEEINTFLAKVPTTALNAVGALVMAEQIVLATFILTAFGKEPGLDTLLAICALSTAFGGVAYKFFEKKRDTHKPAEFASAAQHQEEEPKE